MTWVICSFCKKRCNGFWGFICRKRADYRTTSSWDHNIHSKEIYKRKTGFISYFSRKRSSQESSRESYRKTTRFIRSFSMKKKRSNYKGINIRKKHRESSRRVHQLLLQEEVIPGVIQVELQEDD
jgi:hypothetical protein